MCNNCVHRFECRNEFGRNHDVMLGSRECRLVWDDFVADVEKKIEKRRQKDDRLRGNGRKDSVSCD